MTANPISSFSVWYDGRAGTYKNIGAYFPDFGLRANPSSINIDNGNVATFRAVIPAVKLYTNNVTFSATVTPTPAAGSLTVSFPNGNTLSSYPDSLLVRVYAAAGTTSGAYTVTITGKGPNGTPIHKRDVALNVGLVGVTSIDELAPAYELTQNYPNPFNPGTVIKYSVANDDFVSIKVYDATGKFVASLVNEKKNAGSHTVNFNGSNLSSGMYFYKIESGNFVETKKMLLMK